MASIDGRKPISSIKGIGTTDNTLFLLSDRFASLNFNGSIPRDNTLVYASDLTVGQTIFNSDPTARDNSFFITRIDTEAVTVESIQETAYSLYFLGENDIEEKYTYGAENVNGSFSQNHLFNVYKDNLSDLNLGTNGWMITNQGNAIFSNVFVRGTVEATSGKIDGILSVGESKTGDPLVTIGKNIFNSASFEGTTSEHSGIFLNKNNYFMGYDAPTSIPVTSIVVTNDTEDNILRKATFTLANHTLAVNDLVSISGFTEDKFLELDNVFPVKEITTNTFTVYYKNEISGTTNPISASLKVESFALNNVYGVTSFSLTQTTASENISTVNVYFNNNYTVLFSAGQIIDLNSILNSNLDINAEYKILSVTEVVGQSNDYITIETPRVTAGTYTTDVGQISLYDTNYKFKVGDDDNSMSYNSYTGALTVTGTINASSGNFTNAVTVGKPNLSYAVSNKQLTNNEATLTTSTVHSFVVGDSVTVSGVDATFNGTYTITSVPTGVTFVYAKTATNVTSTPVSPVGEVSRGLSNEGTIFIGYGTNQITINGTGSSTTSAIFAGAGNYANSDTGFFIDASGRFSLGSALTWDGTTLTISGAGSGIQPGNGVTVNASNQITSISSSSGITISSGSTSGARVQLDSNGLKAYNSSGTNTVAINSDGSALFSGTVNASAGTFTGNISAQGKFTTSTAGLVFGTNVSGSYDGLYLNSNNYFMTNSTVAIFRTGDASRFIKVNSTDSGTRLQIDTNNATYAVEVGGSVRATADVRATYFYGTLLGNASTATDAGALDSLNSTQFLRSDASDTFAAGTLTIAPTNSNADFVFVGGGSTLTNDPILRANGGANAWGRIGIPTNRIFRGDFQSLFVGGVAVSSDIRVKTSIENSDLGLDFINMLRPVKYKMVNGYKKQFDEDGNLIENLPGTRWHYGLIAQELKEVLDSYNLDSAMWTIEDFEQDPDSLQAISYTEIISPLIKAVQQISDTLESLENRLAALES